MKIVTYKELLKKEEFLPLMYLAFGWPFNSKEFEEIIKIDPRLNKSPVGFCALENDHVVGFVGVMDLSTKNVEGEKEKAGGVWGVSTLPSHSRRGISTALMNEAHQYFKDKGYAFSFLTTSHSIIAYNFYQKLGYEDATHFPSAFKFVGKKVSKAKEKAKVDLGKVLEIYERFSSERTGFVVRDEDYLRAMMKREESQHEKPEEVMAEQGAYAIFKEWGENLCIDEIVANRQDEAKNLIRKIENRAKTIVYDRIVLDDRLLRTYSSMGYMTQSSSYALLMCKQLQNQTTFKEVYGDKFYMSNLDYF